MLLSNVPLDLNYNKLCNNANKETKNSPIMSSPLIMLLYLKMELGGMEDLFPM